MVAKNLLISPGHSVSLLIEPGMILYKMTGRFIICIVPGPSGVREITSEELLQFFKQWDDHLQQNPDDRDRMLEKEMEFDSVLDFDEKYIKLLRAAITKMVKDMPR